jgi:hypothetical protein
VAHPATKPLTVTLLSEDFSKFLLRALEDEYRVCSGEQRAVSCCKDGSHGAVRGFKTSSKELRSQAEVMRDVRASAPMSVTSAFFWVVMQRTLVVTDVSRQPVSPIFNMQSLEDENYRLSQNVRHKLPMYGA